MTPFAIDIEPSVLRQIFPAWWIEIPATFEETFVTEGGYWHAWHADRSVSVTSTVLTNASGPGRAEEIAEMFPDILPDCGGSPVDEVPPGLLGRATFGPVPEEALPARAGHALSGVLAMDGRIAVVTITTDDEAWARRVWMSIRGVAAPLPPTLPSRAERRLAARKAGRRHH